MVGLVFVRVARCVFFVDGDFLVSYDCRLVTFGCFVLRVIEEVFCSLYKLNVHGFLGKVFFPIFIAHNAIDFTPERRI